MFLTFPPLLVNKVVCYARTGERTGDDTASGNVEKGIIASFSVDSALVPVGGDVELRCRVTSMRGVSFVQLSKWIPSTMRYEVLTTNMVKEDSIREINRYSIDAEEYGDDGYDFSFTITGSSFFTILELFNHL